MTRIGSSTGVRLPRPHLRKRDLMLKALLWFVIIVFVIGLLVVFGILDLIF